MITETKVEPRGRTRLTVNREDLQIGDLLVSRDGNHKILDVSHSRGVGKTTRTHVMIDADGRQFRQPVYGVRIVYRKDET